MMRFFPLMLMLLWPAFVQAEVTVDLAMVRMPPPVAENAAAYMTLHNDSDTPVEIVSVSSDAAVRTEFHTMSMQSGMMHMMPMSRVIVTEHGYLHLEQGGDHLMLIGLKHTLKAGEKINVRMQTAEGAVIEVEVPVHDLREMPEHHGMH